jgi:hypothetical protein
MQITPSIVTNNLTSLKTSINLIVYDCTQKIDFQQFFKIVHGQNVIFVCNKADLMGKYGNLTTIETILAFC